MLFTKVIGNYQISLKSTETSLYIEYEEQEGVKKGKGEFSTDIIIEMSNGMMDSAASIIEYLKETNNNKIEILQNGNVQIQLLFVIGSKKNIRNLVFPMKNEEMGKIDFLIKQNKNLKTQVRILQEKVKNLQAMQAKMRQVDQLFNKVKYLQTRQQNLQNQIREMKQAKTLTLDQLTVRQIKFNSGWIVTECGKNYFGILCGKYPDGYWLRWNDGPYKYLQTQ